MIDTVEYYRDYISGKPSLKTPSGWVRRNTRTKRNKIERSFTSFIHKQTGMFVRFYDRRMVVRVSLPRLLFTKNVRLISSQIQLEKALGMADTLTDQLATDSIITKIFRRVDLVWQVRGNMQDFILAHRLLKHPEIDKLAWVWQDETIMWAGREMSITMYDKFLSARKKSKNVIRVEIRFRGKKLKDELHNGMPVTKLDLLKCYSLFRRKVLCFYPRPFPDKSRLSIEKILKLAIQEKWKIQKQPAFEYLIRGLSRKRRREKIKNVTATLLKSYGIDWRREFPLNKLPQIDSQPHFDASLIPFQARFFNLLEKIRKKMIKRQSQ